MGSIRSAVKKLGGLGVAAVTSGDAVSRGQSDDRIAVPATTASYVVGISPSLLRRWENAGLLMPELLERRANRRFVIYSLEDLVQARVVAQLVQRGISMRQIRRVVEAVRNHDHKYPLASLSWAVCGREAFVRTDHGWVGGRAPLQYVMPETLDLETIRASVRDRVRERRGAAGSLSKRRGVRSSAEVFEGTRTPLSAVQSYLERGFGTERILQAYPHLTEADVELARTLLGETAAAG